MLSSITFKDIFTNAPIGTVLLSGRLEIIHINDALGSLLGFKETELRGNNVTDIVQPGDYGKVQDAVNTLNLDRRLALPLEIQCRPKSGPLIALRWIAWRVNEGEETCFIFQVVSQTEGNVSSSEIGMAVEHEAELQEKINILNAITSKMPVVIYRYSRQNGITSLFGNPKLIQSFERSKMVKLTVAKALSHIINKVSSFKDHQGYLNFSSSNYEGAEDVYFDNFVFENERDRTESGFIGLALDVTERRIAEHNLRRNTKNLEKINKELNQFAYVVSHDLKTPLRGIITLSEWIEEDLKEVATDEVRHNLRLMRARVQRMESLINGILMYSRVTRAAPVYEQVDTSKVIHECIESLLLPDKFTIKLSKKMPVIDYSKIDLERIISNLVTNAVKYHDKSSGLIKIGYREEDEFHVFSVADDGPGIDPVYHEKIFQIFQTLQTHDVLESTGIGLSIVRKIVEDRGGSISVQSALDEGATFTFTVPKDIT